MQILYIMKKAFIIILTILISVACSKSNSRYSNPYLPSQNVSFSVYLNNVDAVDVLNPGGVYITYNYGITGVAIFNAGSQYFAYELTCPNHPIERPCSRLVRKDNKGVFVECKCLHQHNGKEAQFSLINGQSLTPGIEYQLKPYPVTKRGDYLYVNY